MRFPETFVIGLAGVIKTTGHRLAFRLSFASVVLAVVGAHTSLLGEERQGEDSRSRPVELRVLTPSEMAERIDQRIDQRLAKENVKASPQADDAEFLRRISLDVTGLLPHPEVVAGFLADKNQAKRERLVDAVVDDMAYARHQADIWDSVLLQRNSDNKEVALEPLNRWLESGFYYDIPWSEMARRMISASGAQRDNPAVTVYMMDQRPLAPHAATDLYGRAFLGVRLNCAQCHDHPFAAWSHRDYWGVAAFFDKLDFTKKFQRGGSGSVAMSARGRGAMARGMNSSAAGPMTAKESSPGGSRYGIREAANPKKPDLPERALALSPRFLDGMVPALPGPRLPALANWTVSKSNPWFAKAMVNRVWGECFGRGLVHPVDDMHAQNPASHPELLGELTKQFVAHDYSVKFLYRSILRSEAYQRTSRPIAENENAEAELLARMNVKQLTGEQLFDAMFVLLGEQAMVKRGDMEKARERLISYLASDSEPDRLSYSHGIPQLLKLMNDKRYQAGVERKVERMFHKRKKPREVIGALYLETLGRPPREAEQERALALVAKHDGQREKAYTGLLWALLNSSEFLLNH